MASFSWPTISVGAPVGGATSANQATEILALQSIDTKTPVQGQAVMAASQPVVIASNQSALPVTGTFFQTTQPVSGSVSVSNFPASQTVAGSVSVSNFPGTQAVSGTVAVSGVAAGSAVIGKVGIDQTTPGTTNGVQVIAALPVGANIIGKIDVNTLPLAFNAGATSATTQRVIVATDQTALPTKAPVNANGSVINQALTATTASSLVAPANAVGFMLEAESANDQNVRWRVGGTASTTAGMLMEPGRDSGFIPIGFGATVSVCNVVTTANNNVSILWALSA